MTESTTRTFTVNGRTVSTNAYAMERLLDVLRERLHLSGTKEGCGEGECGACSVLLEGKLVNSCLVPIAQCEQKSIDTIESPSLNPILRALQDSFLAHGGAQCGICTPGMLIAAVALLRENHAPTEKDIKIAISGNLCRCTGYSKIVTSILGAAEKLRLAQ